MKPLMSVKVERGKKLAEWEASEHQLTLDGLRAFEQRQRERLEAAQKVRDEQSEKVRPMARKAAK